MSLRPCSLVVFGLMVLVGAQAQAGLKKPVGLKVAQKASDHLKNYRGKDGGLDFFKVRAVMNADNSTDLYVTTLWDPNYLPREGDNFSYYPQIRTLQLKIYDETGKKVKTESLRLDAATKIFHRTDLKRRWRIDADASVDNVKVPTNVPPYEIVSPRTYNLTDSTTVLRRPDLAITAIDAPSTGVQGQSAAVTFTVTETGGDLPAEGVCQADLSIPGTDKRIGYAAPVAISVDPGQTIVCSMIVYFEMSGTWTWRARVRTSWDNADRFNGERNLANNDVTLPLTITGPAVTGTKQGFAWAEASASWLYEFQRSELTQQLIANYLPGFYYESNGFSNSYGDYDVGKVTIDAGTSNRWIQYPLTLSYVERGSDGAVVVAGSGTSSAPSYSDTYEFGAYDPANGASYTAVKSYESDSFVDDATGLWIRIESVRQHDKQTGEQKLNNTTVFSTRTFGHQIYFSRTSGVERNDPNAPFDFYDYVQDSSYIDALQRPANMNGSYQIRLDVQAGNGELFFADATIPMTTTPLDAGSSSGCFHFVYDAPFGGREEQVGCRSSQYATQQGSGSIAF